MTGCKTLAGDRIRLEWLDALWGTCSYGPRIEAVPMAKKYEVVLDRVPVAGGGFVEAFRMALVDLSCFGEQHLDLSGYPHESAEAAMASDWAAIGADVRRAMAAKGIAPENVKPGIGVAERESAAGRSKKAAAD